MSQQKIIFTETSVDHLLKVLFNLKLENTGKEFMLGMEVKLNLKSKAFKFEKFAMTKVAVIGAGMWNFMCQLFTEKWF